ncbi:MAG: proton-conducting transporter membrane subunit [Rhodospirillales bacterium]
MIGAETTILLTLLVPLIGSGLILLTGASPNLRETVILITASLLFLLVASLLPSVYDGARPAVTFIEMVPGLSIAFKVEPLGMTFACIASFLWIVTTVYSIGYMRGHHEENQTRFYFYFAISLMAAIGVAFAANMMTLFIFYEVLTLCTFPLVAHHGTEESKRAGRVYLGILIGTSLAFQLLAIAWTWVAAGTLDFTKGGILADKVSETVAGVLLALYVFGIGKAAVMPFHRWLPAAMVAPTPVSALLHAVAVVKAGVFTVVKVITYIFGIDFLSDIPQTQILSWVAAFTMLTASIIALGKDNLKARLAYSTVSQLSYIVLGATLATGLGIVASGMHIAMHAFGKITLFFCAGAILVAAHKTEISQMDGLGRTMPYTYTAFLIGSLCVIGLPPMGGAWSKFYLITAAADAGQIILVLAYMASTLLAIGYLLPVVVRGFLKPVPVTTNRDHADLSASDHKHDDIAAEDMGIREAPLSCLLAMAVSSAGCLLLFFFADSLFEMLGGIFRN